MGDSYHNIIYSCRPLPLTDELWDQIRVDCGREFALILFIQELLSSYRTNVLRESYLQTRSTQVITSGRNTIEEKVDSGPVGFLAGYYCTHYNHLAKRHWVEVNSTVNYPIKQALVHMQHNSIIDMDCPTATYCVSYMAAKLCQVGIQQHIRAWNNHRIPGMCTNLCNKRYFHNYVAMYIPLCVSVETENGNGNGNRKRKRERVVTAIRTVS